jgi:hypothetical protein
MRFSRPPGTCARTLSVVLRRERRLMQMPRERYRAPHLITSALKQNESGTTFAASKQLGWDANASPLNSACEGRCGSGIVKRIQTTKVVIGNLRDASFGWNHRRVG